MSCESQTDDSEDDSDDSQDFEKKVNTGDNKFSRSVNIIMNVYTNILIVPIYY